MGNEVSSLDIEDDQDGPIREENPGFSTEIKNGPITLQSSPGVEVGSKQPVQQEKVITSSQKTIVISPISNGGVTNLQTNPPPQAAKSKFSLAILHPSPGHTAFQPNGLDVGAVKPQVTLIQSQKGKENINGVQNPASPSALMTEEVYLSQAKPTEVESAPEKPKEVSIFHRLFKPDKKVEFEAPLQLEVPENQAVTITVDKNKVLQSTPQSSNTQPQNIDDNKRVAVQEQSSESASVSASPETISAALQTTPPPEINPVMSFFKTLVTPNKSVPKSEEEVKGEADDKKKENGGLRKSSSKKEKTKSAVQQTAETENKGLKKSDSPKSKTLSRLFRQKSKKEEQQTSGSNVVLEQPVVSVTSQRPAPEQILTQDPKSSDVPSQITASEDEKKAAKEPAPRPKPFWRKSFKGDPQPSKIQENVVVEQPVVSLSLNTAKSAPEQVVIQDTKPSDFEIPPQDNGKPAEEVVTRSVPFWKKSFKGEPQPRKPQENVVVEQPVVSLSLNSEKSVPEQVVIQDTKPSDSDIPAQDNGKPAQEVSSWPVPFWRKSSKGEPQPIKIQENSLPEEPQPVQLTLTASAEPGPQTNKGDSGDKTAAAGSKSQESLGKKTEDGKNSKPKLMMFFKQLSVIGDGSNPSADEKSTNSPTLDITDGAEVGKSEKTVVTAVIEPPPQKGKENLKEKKASAEKLTKQESRESQEAAGSAQFQAPDAVLVQNGGESSKEGQLKKIEKRQSLGSFFKAIGPKRMCDAEVQTDPVSILPAEKAK